MTQNVDRIRVCEPDITNKEIASVTEAIEAGEVSSTAPPVGRFEKAFAEKVGVKHAVAVNSCGSALFLTAWALGIREGDEVIVPTFTMAATAYAVTQCGATPVFVDCEENGNIDVGRIEEKITEKTKAIFPVHIYGHPCDMDAITAIAKKHDLLVVEDAAEALGATYKGSMAGSLSDAGCHSFYANKLITTGEGGMITTDNSTLAEELSKLRGYYLSSGASRFASHEKLAWNMRMSALEAALGLAQLERLEELVKKRRKNAEDYTTDMASLSHHLVFPEEKEDVFNVYWMYGIVLKEEGKRNALQEFLAQRGIETRPFFTPMHQVPFYQTEPPEELPVSERLGRNGLYLPSSSQLSKEQKERVISAVKEFFV